MPTSTPDAALGGGKGETLLKIPNYNQLIYFTKESSLPLDNTFNVVILSQIIFLSFTPPSSCTISSKHVLYAAFDRSSSIAG